MRAFTLSRNAAGQLVFTGSDHIAHEYVVIVRAFPISAPDEGISIIGESGHELAWIVKLDDLDQHNRDQITAELAVREFMPKITHIRQVSTFATPSTWTVETDKGTTDLILKAEDHIRRLPGNALLVVDSQGISYMIADIDHMDRHSRRMLDRFL